MPFADVNALLIAHLTPLNHPVRVVSRVPDPRPERLVQVRRVGGEAMWPVRDGARIDIWCWAATDADAMTLALKIRGDIWALAGASLGEVPCYRVQEFMAPRLDEDPNTNSPRVWATYRLDVRADAVISPTR